MAIKQGQRNNTIAGFFVLTSIIGFVALIITISDISGFGDFHEYEIEFSPELGTPGLEAGAMVTLAGVPVGSVTEVNLEFDAATQAAHYVRVVISIPEQYVVRHGTLAGLVVPVIGSGASINLEGLGDGEPLQANQRLEGMYAPSPFLRSAGIGPKQIAQVQHVIERVEDISGDVAEISEFARTDGLVSGRKIIDRLNEIIRLVDETVAAIRADWPAWSERITSIMAKTETATDTANELLVDGRDLVANADGGITEVRGTIDEVGTKVTDSVENVREITERAKTEWADKITLLVDSTSEKMEQLDTMLADVDASLTTALPEVARVLGNMRIASDNLKLSMIEIRNEPWRLMAAPSERALEESLLYDSVRTYANAVSDLDASIAALKALRERYGDDFDAQSDPVKHLVELLDANYAKFEAAEKALYDFVLENTGK